VHCYGENTLALNTQEQHYKAIELSTVNEPDASAYIYTFGQNRALWHRLEISISANNSVGEHETDLDQTIAIISTHLFS